MNVRDTENCSLIFRHCYQHHFLRKLKLNRSVMVIDLHLRLLCETQNRFESLSKVMASCYFEYFDNLANLSMS